MAIKKKIAVIGLKGLPAYGGAASVGENIIAQLKHEFDFYVYAVSSHTKLETGAYNGINQIVFNSIKFKKLNVIIYYIRSALHCVLRGDYDLIHLHHRDAIFISFLLKIKYRIILTTHGTVATEKWSRYSGIFSIQDQLFLKLPTVVVCPSKKDKEYVLQYRKNSVYFIPNGTTLSSDFTKTNINCTNTLSFAAGRIVPSKGCHNLLEALKIINFKGELFIAGDFSQMRKYSDQLFYRASGLNVKWLGLIKEKEKLFSILSKSDLFIFPSELESMSMMLLEAASLGIPIIASDIRENKDVFNENEVLFYRVNDISDFAAKIVWALSHYDEMIKKSKVAIQRLKNQNQWPQIAMQYQSIYEMLIKQEK